MAIREINRKSGVRYQVQYRGNDNRWMTKVFRTKREANAHEAHLKNEKHSGRPISNIGNQISLDEYAQYWLSKRQLVDTSGWRAEQVQQYKRYMLPSVGQKKLKTVTPADVESVLMHMGANGRAEQTQLHIFNLLRKMFRYAIEKDKILSENPVVLDLKPRVPIKEAPHLNLEELKKLLLYVKDKRYGVAVWIQLYLGLRPNELQALRWSDLDLGVGIIHIRRAYIRKTRQFRDYPKGRKQHSKPIPPELLELLRLIKGQGREDGLVVTSSKGEVLPYEGYCRTLQRYCREIGIRVVGTYGLRHSTGFIYKSHGATTHDLNKLFEHSSMKVTERYDHVPDTNLHRVAKVIQLFPPECCTNVAQSTFTRVDERKESVISNQNYD